MNRASDTSPKLNEAQEMLLGKFFDQEATFFERFAARRLLNQSEAARRYLGVLEQTQRSLQRSISEEKISLWTRIAARLHQEERGAVLLGRRAIARETHLSGFWMKGGVAAALMAAAAFIVMPQTATSPVPGATAIQRGVPFTSSVSTGTQLYARRAPVSVGVDWMRSDGRLQIVHGPDERAPVIYIKRRANRMGPVMQAESNSQGIVIQERNAPRGITVSD